jgi:hypothetical protein
MAAGFRVRAGLALALLAAPIPAGSLRAAVLPIDDDDATWRVVREFEERRAILPGYAAAAEGPYLPTDPEANLLVASSALRGLDAAPPVAAAGGGALLDAIDRPFFEPFEGGGEPDFITHALVPAISRGIQTIRREADSILNGMGDRFVLGGLVYRALVETYTARIHSDQMRRFGAKDAMEAPGEKKDAKEPVSPAMRVMRLILGYLFGALWIVGLYLWFTWRRR